MNTQPMIDIATALSPQSLNFITPRCSGKTTAALKIAANQDDEVLVCTNTYEQFKLYQTHLGHKARYLPHNGFKHRYFAMPAFKLGIVDDLVLDTRDSRFLFARYLAEIIPLCDRVLCFSSRYDEIDMAILAQRQLTTITLPPPAYEPEWELAMRENLTDTLFNAVFKNEWFTPLPNPEQSKKKKIGVEFK